MGNSRHILQKIARNAQQFGMSAVFDGSKVTIENGSNDIEISYEQRSFSPEQVGGVNDQVSPFLGIGNGAPGYICLRNKNALSVDHGTFFVDGNIAKAFSICCSFANDIKLLKEDLSLLQEIRSNSDVSMLGQ